MEEGEHQVGIGRYDDEGDGFVVSDDEEIEERGGRLSKIKTQGAQKYKDRKRYNSEEEEEEEDEEDEEDEETDDAYTERKQETPRKNRRRIVDDDDEDED